MIGAFVYEWKTAIAVLVALGCIVGSLNMLATSAGL